MKDTLSEILILDFTTRLPGPMSTMQLKDLGAEVIKVENTDIGEDPFKKGLLIEVAPYFKDWYDQINSSKEIQSFSFKKENARLLDLINKSDLIVAPHNSYFKNLLKESTSSVLYIAGGKGEYKSLHDLNALAMSQTFSQNLKAGGDLPYLPFAGICFSQKIALESMALLLNKEKKSKTVYLKDLSQDIFDKLYSTLTLNSSKQFLHTGAFPCYTVYELADGHKACFAAIEEKFWNRFCELLEFPFSESDRFDLSGKVYSTIQEKLNNFQSHELSELIKGHDICLTIIS